MSAIPSYPKIYALGHAAIPDIFADPVLVQEKIDGSQFSFAMLDAGDGTGVRLHMRSRGQVVRAEAAGMFAPGVAVVLAIQDRLRPGYVYRAEYLRAPRHNILAYERCPDRHFVVYDVEDLDAGSSTFLPVAAVRDEVERIGLEYVPVFGEALVLRDRQDLVELLARPSCLGGMIEGVVVKNYRRFCIDGKVQMGKYVSEKFKEVQPGAWRAAKPTNGDIVEAIIDKLRTEARWQKAVAHLRDRNELQDDPRDIGPLIREAQGDIEQEEGARIASELYLHFLPQIRRGVTRGLPEWYKAHLADRAFPTKGAA